MIEDVAAVIVGLSGGIVSGLSLRGSLLAARTGVTQIAVPLGLLLATVLLSCATAWTLFTEYVSSDGWYWLGGGVVVGIGLGEAAYRRATSRRRPRGAARNS